MRAQATNLSTFLQATNHFMRDNGIFQIPVSWNSDSLIYGLVGTRIKLPEKMVFMGTEIPGKEFMAFLPVVERPAADVLERSAVRGQRDMISQWWSVQKCANGMLLEMKELGEPRQRALEMRKRGEEAERDGRNVDAAWAFLKSAVIFYKLGMARDTVAVEFFGSARNFKAAALHPSSAILYESAFNSISSDEYAVAAAEQWLLSVQQEADPATKRFRINRGLIYAAHRPHGDVYWDLLRESGEMHKRAGKYFAAGADYMRAAWSVVQRGTPNKQQWMNISLLLTSAAEVFEAKENDTLAPQVRGLLDIALELAEGI